MDGEADDLLTIPVVVEHDVRVHRLRAVLRPVDDEGDVFPVGGYARLDFVARAEIFGLALHLRKRCADGFGVLHGLYLLLI